MMHASLAAAQGGHAERPAEDIVDEEACEHSEEGQTEDEDETVITPEWSLAIDGHFSLVSNQTDRSLLNITFGGGLRAAYHPHRSPWGIQLLMEQNAWYATELFTGVLAGVRNIGIGPEFLWANNLIRTSMAMGISMLAHDTSLHRKHSTGFFSDLRPASIRWAVGERVFVEFTPLHAVILAPVLHHPRLIIIQYRSTLSLEVRLR